jgi:thiamine pyrophosphate-dependent acetolactate synthase large subunit-like protein
VQATDVARVVLETLPDALCVSSLGTATSALRAASDDGPHLYFGAAMGSALAAALGVAEAVPDRTVVALLGDGEALMGASTLWSVAAYRPGNLVIVVLADGRYAITGGQPLNGPLRLADVATTLGCSGARVTDEPSLGAALPAARPLFVEAVVDDPARPGPSPFVDPAWVVHNFAAAVARGPSSEEDSA